jgi:transcriptional regulator with XRE-family HTH domain
MEDHLSRNIKTLREKFNLTQEELGSYLGILREQVSYYENGKREIPLEQLNKISDLFGVELIDLMEKDFDHFKANISFAFRANEISSADMESLAKVKKIVKNYLSMLKVENEN